jgi:hypothetical protein
MRSPSRYKQMALPNGIYMAGPDRLEAKPAAPTLEDVGRGGRELLSARRRSDQREAMQAPIEDVRAAPQSLHSHRAEHRDGRVP